MKSRKSCLTKEQMGYSTPTCPLCESNSTRPRPGYQHMETGRWSLCQCTDCGASFVDPMPDSETLAKYYDEDYYGAGEGKFLDCVERIIRFFRYLRARIVRRLIPAGRVLDVGCGRGMMLKYLKNWGYEVDGIELDTVAAVRARKNLGQEIFHTLEEPAQFLDRDYQAICFWHSLEHLPEPGKALKIADRLLVHGGLLIISAPNIESIQSRLSGRTWLHLDLPRHLIHFDMKGLISYCQERGYHLIRQQQFSQEYNVIDTLCYLYSKLGLNHLYPYDLIRGKNRPETCIRDLGPLKTVLGMSLLIPLTGLAFLISNIFSLLKCGSTTTLLLRKSVDVSK